MLLVLLADDAFAFMVAWELMSVASYMLVAYQHQHAANRRAAFLYLLMAQVGALAILLGFGVLVGAGKAGDFSFDALRQAHLTLNWGSVAFGLALFGFGMKAGFSAGTCLVARSAPGGALAYFGADERRDAENCCVRVRAVLLRSDRRCALGLGRGDLAHRQHFGAARYSLRLDAEQS